MPSAISVVVPLHNAAPWVGEALRSVYAQAHPPAEVIVVDDGSTDGGPALVAREFPGARLIRTARGGPSRARNLGWRAAAGAWVQFLDADDLLAPEKLALQARRCAGAAADLAVLYSPWQRYAERGGAWGPEGPVLRPQLGAAPLDRLLASDGFVQLGAALFRRAWLERIGGFDEAHALIEDVDLMLRIAMAGGAFIEAPAPRPLAFYRRRPGSLSQADGRAFVEGCVRNAELLERHWRAVGELSPARARQIAAVYFQGARFFAAHDAARFEALVRRIEALGPGMLPEGPPALRALSRLIGYRGAELVAAQYRRAKAAVRR